MYGDMDAEEFYKILFKELQAEDFLIIIWLMVTFYATLGKKKKMCEKLQSGIMVCICSSEKEDP